MEDASVNFKRRNPPFAAVERHDVIGGAQNLFDIDFFETQPVLGKKALGALAVGAPASCVHADVDVHPSILPFLRGSQANTLAGPHQN